ncbi:CLIP-associating protein 2 isoform X1 [Lates japonicus]|uniref:CLIP-associating protein 2 isoform X1 n=1 Tax=Lates japonicus TaxID=270547 RepID=A0AAD3NDZ1_LATJO|nr:CLIP-associating protein 2 isoform X1 [Lates japonicus]
MASEPEQQHLWPRAPLWWSWLTALITDRYPEHLKSCHRLSASVSRPFASHRAGIKRSVQKDVTRRLQVGQTTDYLNDPHRSPDVEQTNLPADKTIDELTDGESQYFKTLPLRMPDAFEYLGCHMVVGAELVGVLGGGGGGEARGLFFLCCLFFS